MIFLRKLICSNGVYYLYTQGMKGNIDCQNAIKTVFNSFTLIIKNNFFSKLVKFYTSNYTTIIDRKTCRVKNLILHPYF